MLDTSLFSWEDQDINSMIGPDFCFSTSKKHPTKWFRARVGYREEFVAHLMNHVASLDKVGSCWSPAIYKDGRAGTAHAERVDSVVFDLDKGQPFAEIKLCVAKLEAVIASTHSHLATHSNFPCPHLEKHGGDAEALMRAKGFHECVVAGARVRCDDAGKPIVKMIDGKRVITIDHKPCEKYRVALFPVRSWQRKEDADVIRYRIGLLALAEKLGLMIDKSCTNVNRLYFDSRHKPGTTPVVVHLEGDPVDPWSNVEIPAEMMRARGKSDPREKGGIIGEFNRAFPILEAITKFDLPYEESGNRPDRLTYLGSTNGNGAEILDNGYTMCVYSESDPVHAHCESPKSGFGFANSFDLVRVHRFHEMDTEADMALDIQDRPSFKAMLAFTREVLASAPEDMVDDADIADGGNERGVTCSSRKRVPLEWACDVEPVLFESYLIKGVLPDDTMSVVYGPSNSGKTFFALDMAYHIALGRSWNGRRVREAAVLYLAAEGGRGLLNRVVAYRREYGPTSAFAIRRAPLDLLKPQGDVREIVSLAQEVKTQTKRSRLLIVVDTLSRAIAGGDENSPVDMTAFIANIDAIRAACGGHVMVIHHSGKDIAKGARGHSSLRAATDTEIELREHSGALTANVAKQRDLAGGEEFAFSLRCVDMGTDQDGDTVTSCIVVSDANPAKRVKLSPSEKGAVKTLLSLADGKPVEEKPWKQACIAGRDVSTADTEESRRRATDRTIKSLVAKGVITFANGSYRYLLGKVCNDVGFDAEDVPAEGG